MIFRNIIFSACLVGLMVGVLLTVAQSLGVTPIIYAAEVYEVADTSVSETVSEAEGAGHGHASGDHHHESEAWAPEDGIERTFYSFVSNVLAGIGFAAVLLALMSQLQVMGVTRVSPLKGLVWGLAGFAVFFAVPGIGLPPEIPGVEAAAVAHRQGWWLFAAVGSGVGLATLAFAPKWFKLLGVLAVALPFLVGAPAHPGPEFSHPDADAVAALTELHHQFIVASGLANLLFWLALGVLSAWLLNRFILKGESEDVAAPA